MPEVARRGDAGVVHCTGYVMATASDDVLVNNRGVVRIGDTSSVHLLPARRRCVAHTAAVSAASQTVFVNNRPMARRGDPLGGCTRIATGSADVVAG
jgi:uncharacterized Zn-binding protein involved in type VI secretion